jgi:hypothetical protein
MTDLTALTEITAPTTDDLVYVVDAPTGAKNPRKCSIANLVASADIDAAKITSGTLPIAQLPTVTIAKGGTGATTDSAARTALGVAIGSDVQAYNSATALTTNRLNDFAAPNAAVALGSQKITGLADGVASTDAATKGQVDTAVASDITLKGAYNANTNNPNLDNSPTAGTILTGDHYVVSVAGTFYTESLQVGDSLISEVDNPSGITDWIITNSQIVTPIVTANIADEAVTEGKLYISNAGNNGEFLSKQSGNNGGLTWATVPAGYNAPTIGSTSIASGATVASLAGLTNLTATGTLTSGQVNILAEGDLRLEDASGNEYVAVEAPATVGTSYTVKLPAAIGSAGDALKVTSVAGTVQTMEWDSAGGGAEATPVLQASNYSAANQSPATEGSSAVSIFAKTIDSNNQGLYVRVKKNGQYEDVQIA